MLEARYILLFIINDMRLRLFWTLLAAFALVIVLGICGMLGFVTFAVSGVWQPGPFRETMNETQRAYGLFLGDYYVANGNSWNGIEQRLEQTPFSLGTGTNHYAIVDPHGRVVASNDASIQVGTALDLSPRDHGITIETHGQALGMLVARPDAPDGIGFRRPNPIAIAVGRSLLLAGLTLGGLLMLLAAALAGWITRPLRRVTDAARVVASGRLDIQVRGARIRELDDLARTFNSMSQALTDADRQRRQMTADIAHELRTPLSIVKGRLEGLQDGVYQATPVQIAGLLDETALLERLIDDLRVLALAEAGQLPLYAEPTAPLELLDDVAAAFAARAEQQGITLHVDAAANLPEIAVDPQRMRQVLGNIVANALRYTPTGGSVLLRASANPVEALPLSDGLRVSNAAATLSIVFAVSDTGVGIAPADLPHIFNRFYRADRSRARTSGGSGLGLAIARQIVEAHGGTVWAKSQPGAGTTIALRIPMDMQEID